MDHDQVLKGLAGHDVARAQVVLGQPQGLASGGAGGLAQVGAGGGEKGGARKGQAQGLGRDLHRRGGAHEGAGAAGGAGVVLGKHQLVVGDLAALVAGADGAQLLQGEKIRARVHDTAGDDDRRDVDAAQGHEVGGQALVAAGHKDAGVEGGRLGVDLDHVGNGVAAGQRVVDAVVALGLAVADVGAEVARAVAARLGHAGADLLDQFKEAGAAGVGVAGGGLDDDLRLVQVLDAPARA